jgi:hypothetical protein
MSRGCRSCSGGLSAIEPPKSLGRRYHFEFHAYPVEPAPSRSVTSFITEAVIHSLEAKVPTREARRTHHALLGVNRNRARSSAIGYIVVSQVTC